MSTQIKELQQLLFKELSPVLEAHGFKPRLRDQSFRLSKSFGWALFHLSFIPHRNVDFDVTADVALRIDAVHELLYADNSQLSEKQKLETATLGCELGNYFEGKQRRWTVANRSDLKSVVVSISEAFETIALPYINQYSNLNEALKVLSRNDKTGWLHSPFHDYRCSKALILAFILGKHDQVGKLGKQGLEFLESHNDPRLKFFEQIVKRINSLQASK